MQHMIALFASVMCSYSIRPLTSYTHNKSEKKKLIYTQINVYAVTGCQHIWCDNLSNQKIGAQPDKQCTLLHFLDYGSQFSKLILEIYILKLNF
jgi:hypothetical protein